MYNIAPRNGTAFFLHAGQRLAVSDPLGEQVADLVAFNRNDTLEALSSGQTIDYASRIHLTTGCKLYSNRSNVMLRIVEDDIGRHDFMMTPCSVPLFRIIYDDPDPHPACSENLAAALGPYGVLPDAIPAAFNCFMNVPVDCETGSIRVLPPRSQTGDRIVFLAEMDLLIGLTACAAGQSNNFRFKPIHYAIDG